MVRVGTRQLKSKPRVKASYEDMWEIVEHSSFLFPSTNGLTNLCLKLNRVLLDRGGTHRLECFA